MSDANMIEKRYNETTATGKKGNTRKTNFDEKNYLNLKLDDSENKRDVKIRLLPFSASPEHFNGFDDFDPFFTILAHSLKVNKEISRSGFKSFICHNDKNIGGDYDGCPLCEKSKEFYKKANECQNELEKKAFIKAGGQYKAKEMYIVRVIERGHEEDGVKFWRFAAHTDGSGFYDKLMEKYKIRDAESVEATGEKYNIFDLKNGRDIIITIKRGADDKLSYDITEAGFPSPIAKTDEQIMEWVNDEKVWSDMYATKNNDYLQLIADGEIPVFDQNKKKYVSKTEFMKNSKSDASVEKQDEEPKPAQQSKPEPTKVEEKANEAGDDLPF